MTFLNPCTKPTQTGEVRSSRVPVPAVFSSRPCTICHQAACLSTESRLSIFLITGLARGIYYTCTYGQITSMCLTHEQALILLFVHTGGRTAWSCAISIGPTLEIPARLWFDGKYVENAGEDAAERAWAALTTGDGGQDV